MDSFVNGRVFSGPLNCRARRLTVAHRVFAVALLCAVWSLVPQGQALAYVDPSVMTYTIQAVAGVAVALSAVIGVVFRRTRRKIFELFNIDENAHKVVEGEVGRVDPRATDAQQRYEASRQSALRIEHEFELRAPTAPRMVRPRARFLYALAICLFMAFIVFIAPALEIFGANGDSLVFGLPEVWWVPLVFCLPLAVLVAVCASVLRGRPFYIVLAVLFALTLAAYVQSLFLNTGMLPADGGFIGWDEPFFIFKDVVSGIVWLAIIGLVVFASVRWPHMLLKGSTALACAIMIMQLVGVVSVAADATKTSAANMARPYVTQGELLTVSPKSNVVVFVLDTYDTAILEDILEEDPQFLQGFDDFTYFPDSVGTMIPTTNAIPNMLTALKPEPGQDVAEYRRTKYERSTYLKDIHDQGYTIGMYSDSLMMDFNNPADLAVTELTQNVHPVSQAPVDVWRTFVVMEQCALYREAPWLLKPVFWYYTSDLNNRMIADSGEGDMHDSLYELDDAAILKMVRERRLQPTDQGVAGAFRFIHLFGPHFPYSVDEEGANVGTNQSDQISQAKGSMKVVKEYIAQLKELGLYDEATLVVTADHGVWFLTHDPVSNPISPIMLVKPRKQPAADGARQPVRTSAAPVCHDDIQPTVMQAIGGDVAKYGTGTSLLDVPEDAGASRVRYFDALTNAGGEGQRFVEYAIQGDVRDLSHWSKTGNVWYGA